MSFAYCTLMETFFNRFIFCLFLHLFAMEKVAPVPLFRPLCKCISYKNGKVWVNFKNISSFGMLTATPARLFRSTPSLWILQYVFLKNKNFLIKTHYKIHKEGVPLKSLAGVAASILKLLIFLKFTQTLPFL